MFQPNQRLRYNVPSKETNNQISLEAPVNRNEYQIPHQMRNTLMQTNSPSPNPRNLLPPRHENSVTVMELSRTQMSAPPPNLPFIRSVPPPNLVGEPPFIPPQSGIQGQRFQSPSLNPPLHLPPPPLPQMKHFPHVQTTSTDVAFRNMQELGPSRFIQPPHLTDDINRHSFETNHGNFRNNSEFMNTNFTASHEGKMSSFCHNEQMKAGLGNLAMPPNQMKDDFDEESKSSFDKYRREKDQNWIQTWLKRNGKLKQPLALQRKSDDTPTHGYQIHEAQQAFHQSIIFLAKLQHQCRSLESMMASADPQVWKAERNLTEEYKDKCMELHQYLNNEELLQAVKLKMESRKKKRARLKKQRKEANEAWQATKELRESRHQQLEEWRNKMAQLAEDEKQKAELKKSADSTLSSVRKKLADVKRTQEFLKAFQKLRKIRRSAAINQGRYASDAHDVNFEKKVDELTTLMTSQQTVYETEEKTLKVMLEAVEEETRERDKEIKRQKERAKERLEKKLIREKLFGKNAAVSEDDELYPFHMYYRQAEESMEALMQIRHEWDLHLVAPSVPGGSRIPDGFIVPVDPTSDVWASALKQ